MPKLVVLLHLAKAQVPSFLTMWPVLEMRPDSLTVPTMVLVFTTVFILRTLVLFAAEIVSPCYDSSQFPRILILIRLYTCSYVQPWKCQTGGRDHYKCWSRGSLC